MSSYIDNLTRAVAAMHGCRCSHVGTSTVHEMSEGQTVWKGEVETFTLTGHPKADKAFAWGYTDDAGEIRYVAVLNMPPVISPREAVQASIVNAKRK